GHPRLFVQIAKQRVSLVEAAGRELIIVAEHEPIARADQPEESRPGQERRLHHGDFHDRSCANLSSLAPPAASHASISSQVRHRGVPAATSFNVSSGPTLNRASKTERSAKNVPLPLICG